jgi:hypothetical protein
MIIKIMTPHSATCSVCDWAIQGRTVQFPPRNHRWAADSRRKRSDREWPVDHSSQVKHYLCRTIHNQRVVIVFLSNPLLWMGLCWLVMVKHGNLFFHYVCQVHKVRFVASALLDDIGKAGTVPTSARAHLCRLNIVMVSILMITYIF